MNSDTGELLNPSAFEALKKVEPARSKLFMEVPHEFEDEISNMNRKERRRFYRAHKKEWLKALKADKQVKR